MREYTVYAFHTHTKKFRVVYEYVKTADDAMLLSQLAMARKDPEEIILVTPGSNKGIYNMPDTYKRALELEKEVLEYMEED